MHRNRRPLPLVLVLITTLLAGPTMALAQEASAAATADPLKVVPADAVAVLTVRSLAELNQDILTVAEKLGLSLADIGFPPPLEFAKQAVGIAGGLNENGGLAVAVLSLDETKTPDAVAGRIAVFVPVSDVDQFTTAMKPEREGELIRFELAGQPSVGAVKNGFFVIGQTPEVVTEVLRAKGEGLGSGFAPSIAKAYSTQDLMIWARPKAIPDELREEIIGMITAEVLQNNPMMAQAQLQESIARVTESIDDLDQVSLGLTLDAKIGLKFGVVAQLRPDTETARMVEGLKPPAESLLTGLPDEPAVLAGGMAAGDSSPMMDRIRDSLKQVLSPETLGEDVDAEQIGKIRESLLDVIGSTRQMSMSITALPRDSEDGLIGVAVVARVSNSERTQTQVRELFAMAKKLLIDTAVANGELTEENAKVAREAIQWKEDAEKLGGASVDHFTVDLASLPDGPDEEQLETTRKIIGQEGVLVRIAAVGEEHIAVTFGGGAKRFVQIVDGIQKKQAPLAERENIKILAGRLPSEGRIAEAYFGADNLVAMIMNIANRSGQSLPPQVMMFTMGLKETTPIAFTAAKVDKLGLQYDMLVPIELLQTVMEMLQPMLQMFMGGMGGQPGAAPGTAPGAGPN
jgi:hypothetical protein